MIDLKTCPLCDNKCYTVHEEDEWYRLYWGVKCKECGLYLECYYHSEVEAIETWNKRGKNQ